MKFKNYLGLLFIFIVSTINAQTIEIKGTVSDSKTKKGISGANVSIKNSKKGVSSSLDGNYTIKANPNDIVVFSSIGFASQEVKVTKSQTLNMVLSEETNKLEEVVINVGYGTQKKKILPMPFQPFDQKPLTTALCIMLVKHYKEMLLE